VFRKALSTSLLICLGVASALAAPPEDPDQQEAAAPQPVGPVDEAFVHDAALDSLAQMDLNYDALGLSDRKDVRAFALDSVNFHAPALHDLEQLAAPRAVAFPKSLDEYPAYIPNRPWEGADAASFDAIFMRDQFLHDTADAEIYTREGYDGQDPDLRAYAWSTIMQLRQRLLRARDILAHIAPSAAD
jgi:predicted outer membrane protein